MGIAEYWYCVRTSRASCPDTVLVLRQDSWHERSLGTSTKLSLKVLKFCILFECCDCSQYCDGNHLLQVVLSHHMNRCGLGRKRNLWQGVWFISIRESTGSVKSVRIGWYALISTRPHQIAKVVKTGCRDSTFCDMIGLWPIANLSHCRVHRGQAGTAWQHGNGLA
jgi:hypothetical protein